MVPEQKNVVLAVIHTIIEFLKNDKAYVPICATNVNVTLINYPSVHSITNK